MHPGIPHLLTSRQRLTCSYPAVIKALHPEPALQMMKDSGFGAGLNKATVLQHLQKQIAYRSAWLPKIPSCPWHAVAYGCWAQEHTRNTKGALFGPKGLGREAEP